MDNIFTLSALALAAIPLDMGLTAAIRQMGVPRKFLPVLSVILGMGLIALTGVLWQAVVTQGIIVGLAASGLWSGGRTIIESKDKASMPPQ